MESVNKCIAFFEPDHIIVWTQEDKVVLVDEVEEVLAGWQVPRKVDDIHLLSLALTQLLSLLLVHGVELLALDTELL